MLISIKQPLAQIPALALAALLACGFPQAHAQQPTVDPTRIAQARQLLELSGSTKNFELMLPAMMQQMTKLLITQKPEHSSEIADVMQAMQAKFLDRKQELFEQIAVIYAERLSSADIAGLVTFYNSPTGKKFIAVQPDLMKESMAAGQLWGRKIGAEIESTVRQELKKRGIEL